MPDYEFDPHALVVENNLRSDLPYIFDDIGDVLCAIVVYMIVPQIGGVMQQKKQVAEKLGMQPALLYNKINEWKTDGTWQRVVAKLVSLLDADVQAANLQVKAHYPLMVAKILEIATNANGKISARTQLDALGMYFEKIYPMSQAEMPEDDDSAGMFAQKYNSVPAPKPDIVDANVTEVSRDESSE